MDEVKLSLSSYDYLKGCERIVNEEVGLFKIYDGCGYKTVSKIKPEELIESILQENKEYKEFSERKLQEVIELKEEIKKLSSEAHDARFQLALEKRKSNWQKLFGK